MKILADMSGNSPPEKPTLDAVVESEEVQRKRNRVHQRAGSAMLGFVAGLKSLFDEVKH